MSFQKGHRPSHKGRCVTSEPLKNLEWVADVKHYLRNNPRNLALFTLAVNSAFRASDILNLRFENLKQLQNGCIEITTREKKTGKIRLVVLNNATSKILNEHISLCRYTKPDDLVFPGQRGPMGTSYFGRMVKTWITEATLTDGRWSTHTLRKTWVYHQHKTFDVELSTLMFALNHSSERQTLQYMGALTEDVASAYQNAI